MTRSMSGDGTERMQHHERGASARTWLSVDSVPCRGLRLLRVEPFFSFVEGSNPEMTKASRGIERLCLLV